MPTGNRVLLRNTTVIVSPTSAWMTGPRISETSLPWTLWFDRDEGSVGIFAIDGLQVFPADPVLRLAEINQLIRCEGLSCERVIWVGRSIVPGHLVGGDKINPLGGAGRSRRESEKGNNQANNRSDGRHWLRSTRIGISRPAGGLFSFLI